MSAAAAARRGLTPVSAEAHVANALLPGWEFFYAPPDAALACTLCGRPAVYVDAQGEFPMCEKHARDF